MTTLRRIYVGREIDSTEKMLFFKHSSDDSKNVIDVKVKKVIDAAIKAVFSEENSYGIPSRVCLDCSVSRANMVDIQKFMLLFKEVCRSNYIDQNFSMTLRFRIPEDAFFNIEDMRIICNKIYRQLSMVYFSKETKVQVIIPAATLFSSYRFKKDKDTVISCCKEIVEMCSSLSEEEFTISIVNEVYQSTLNTSIKIWKKVALVATDDIPDIIHKVAFSDKRAFEFPVQSALL